MNLFLDLYSYCPPSALLLHHSVGDYSPILPSIMPQYNSMSTFSGWGCYTLCCKRLNALGGDSHISACNGGRKDEGGDRLGRRVIKKRWADGRMTREGGGVCAAQRMVLPSVNSTSCTHTQETPSSGCTRHAALKRAAARHTHVASDVGRRRQRRRR